MSDINTVTMNVSLPAPLKQLVDERVASGLYASASEFVREAIREKAKRDEELAQARARLEQMLLDGLNSGPAELVTDEYFAMLRKKLLSNREERAAG